MTTDFLLPGPIDPLPPSRSSLFATTNILGLEETGYELL